MNCGFHRILLFEILLKNISSNQFTRNFCIWRDFSKWDLANTVLLWMNEKFTLTVNILRQINYIISDFFSICIGFTKFLLKKRESHFPLFSHSKSLLILWVQLKGGYKERIYGRSIWSFEFLSARSIRALIGLAFQ